MANDIFDGIELQGDGQMSPRNARTIRLRLRRNTKLNIEELSALIEKLAQLRDEMANAASIEFFVEDVE
jgi:hypothetical protein